MTAERQRDEFGVSAQAIDGRVEIALDGETSRTISAKEAQRFAYHLTAAYVQAAGADARVVNGRFAIGAAR